jgi:hypothetical protein
MDALPLLIYFACGGFVYPLCRIADSYIERKKAETWAYKLSETISHELRKKGYETTRPDDPKPRKLISVIMPVIFGVILWPLVIVVIVDKAIRAKSR